MKKKQFAIYKTLCVLCCYLFVVSCNKSDIAPEDTLITNEQPMALAVSVPLKLDKETFNSSFKRYTYDATGRCSHIDMNANYITYNYRGNTITETTVFTDPTKAKIIRTYTLNSLGLASTCTFTIGTKAHLWEYEYDSNKMLTKLTNKSKVSTRSVYTTDATSLYKYNSDGNRTSYTYKLSLVQVLIQYSYDRNRYNTTGNEFKGLDWLGKSSKNVASMMMVLPGFYYPNWDSRMDISYYNWTYDAQGYNKQYIMSGATTDIATFTYK